MMRTGRLVLSAFNAPVTIVNHRATDLGVVVLGTIPLGGGHIWFTGIIPWVEGFGNRRVLGDTCIGWNCKMESERHLVQKDYRRKASLSGFISSAVEEIEL